MSLEEEFGAGEGRGEGCVAHAMRLRRAEGSPVHPFPPLLSRSPLSEWLMRHALPQGGPGWIAGHSGLLKGPVSCTGRALLPLSKASPTPAAIPLGSLLVLVPP